MHRKQFQLRRRRLALSFFIAATILVALPADAQITYPPSTFTPAFQAWDNFAGPSGWSLSSHTSDSGHSWAQWGAPGTTGTLTLNGSGEVQNASASEGFYLLSAVPQSANYTVCGWMVPSSASPTVVLWARAQQSAFTGYKLFAGSAIGGIGIYKLINGTQTQIGTTHALTFVASTPYQICLAVSGTTLSATLNGSPLAEPGGTDSSIASAGQAGIDLPNSPNAVVLGFTLK